MVNFPIQIPDCDSHSPALLDFFLSSDSSNQKKSLFSVHRDHFFHFYQKDKSSESTVKFTQASNHCKKVLEAVRLAYANKTKESITFQKLGSQDFWQ